ncbi:MAG: preprotein translocase subunit SecA, partial [Parcubacteria group bacterium CG_4_10_14_0_8_um_filter_35_7]
EARTPLIISAPKEEATEKYYEFAHLVKRLKENEDYNVDEKMRAATLTEGGIQKMEKWLGIDNIYEAGGVETVHHIEQALKSYTLFKRDRDYVVKEGEIIIVDEFTGRLMFGRRYSEGLHQAIEAKEGMQIQRESETLATITFQNYFRLYKKLAGMTGTAATEAEEFAKIYNLEVLVIPTNEPMIRCDFQDRIYRNEKGKFKAIVEEIKARHKKGQPVLVGTVSIEKNELLGEMLAREGIPLEILNAKHHEKEAQIIAQTGRIGAVTVATNMAGRGVDIILGGDPPDREEQKKVISLGGLHVIGTERHEARRIDNQLRGRSGRQGDPGSSQFYISMEDDLMRIFGSERMKGLMAKLGVPEDMPIENKLISRSIEAAQKKVEGYNFDVRKNLVEYDDVINKHRETIYKKRKEILEASIRRKEKLKETVLEMVTNEIEQVVSFHTATKNERDWNIEEIYEVVNSIFSVPSEVRIKLDDIQEEAGIDVQDVKARTKIIKYLIKLARKYYDEIEKGINESAKEIVGTEEPHLMREIEKGILIRAIDTLWIEHLNAMDALRTGIGLRGYGQRDPLIEYKKEAYRLFVELMNLIQKQVTYSIYKVGLARKLAPSLIERRGVVMSAPAKIMEKGKGQFSGVSLPKEEKEKVVKGDNVPVKPRDMMGRKIGRNDPCPCGSGKKYKKCCGR